MKLKTLLNSLPGMAFELRLDTSHAVCFDYCSNAVLSLYGITAKQVIADENNFFSVFVPSQELAIKESLIFCAEEMIDWQMTLKVNINARERHHQFFATPEKQANGDIVWRGFITDISEQYIENDSHVKNEHLLSSLFELSPLGIGLIDLSSTQFVKTNAALQRLLKFSDTQLQQLGLDTLIAEQDVHELSRQWLVLKHQGCFEPHEVCYKNSTNEIIDVLVNGMLVDSFAEQPMLWVIIEDISARKTIERQLISEKIRAEAAGAAKSDFLASMSHEIRTPLNGVLGMLDILVLGEVSTEQKNQLQIAQDSGNVLLSLLNDILDFSKINAGKLQLESTNINIETLLRDVSGPYVYLAKDKGLSFKLAFESDTNNWIKADGLRLKQVLNNLLSNAIKFTKKGHISLTGKLQLQQGNRVLTLAVQDTGIGLTAKQCELLFQPFSQADASTTRQYGGTGLGLAICYELCQAMGGGITANSEHKQGSVFEVWLCVEKGEPQNVPEHIENTVIKWPVPCRVLLVDDNNVNCIIIKLMLKNSGLDVTVAEDGQQALDTLNAHSVKPYFDIVLMDCMMPVMDGYQATAAIRQGHAGEFNRVLPIIALTANALSGDREKCLAAGMTNYLTKPVNQHELISTIARELNINSKNTGDGLNKAEQAANAADANTQASVLWDHDVFLKSLGNMCEMQVHLVSAFIESLQHVAPDINHAVAQQNIAKVATLSHSLKGSAGQMCCYPLAQSAKQINDAAKAEQWPKIKSELAFFNKILTDTLHLLELSQSNNNSKG